MLIELLTIFLQVFIAIWVADFIAGVYHWIKDTYFGPFTPIIGRTFIWGSRLHHIRPRYVLEFSDWELFSSSARWTLLWIIPLIYFTGLNIFTFTLFLVISLNDVIHKYSHLLDHERPAWATFLQKIYISQSHDEHHQHHIDPHDINYCPITPFTNPLLERVNFWKRCEMIVEKYTGIPPRAKVYDFIEDESYPAGVRFISD